MRAGAHPAEGASNTSPCGAKKPKSDSRNRRALGLHFYPLTVHLVIGGLLMWPLTASGFPWDRFVGWPLMAAFVLYLLLGLLRARQWNKRRLKELAA